MNTINKTDITRPHGILFLIKVIPIIFILLLSFVPIFFPNYFPWITNIKWYTIIFAAMTIFQTWVLIMTEYKSKNSLWKNACYVWIVFYTIVIYLTGGLNSSFMFIMVFIPIISTSYLDEKLTKYTGIISTIFLVSLIFFQKGALENPVYIIEHAIHVAVYALMVFLIYKIVQEILHHRYEKELFKRKFIEMNELDKVKQMFLTAMSHQLRTPLTGARWAVEEAIKDKTTAPEMLKESERRIINAIDILGEILKTAEFDLGNINIKIDKNPVVLNSLVTTIVNNLAFMMQIKGNKISYDMPREVVVKGDRKMLELALTNIIDNSFRYSPNGSVKISVEKDEEFGKLTVEDSGIGIDSADMEYVFQKFFRGSNALLVDPNESGVGLYVTKKIIEMHGGEVKISSVIGKGTKVEVLLPLKKIP